MAQIADIQAALALWQTRWGNASAEFKSPIWANNLSDFLGAENRPERGNSRCLIPYYAFKLDDQNQSLPGTDPHPAHFAYQNDPKQFISGGTDFMMDLGLPNSSGAGMPDELDHEPRWKMDCHYYLPTKGARSGLLATRASAFSSNGVGPL